jgi:hypothetical protein
MAYYTDEELAAATAIVSDNILAPLNLQDLSHFVAKDVMHGYIQRQCANALTAAAKVRGHHE